MPYLRDGHAIFARLGAWLGLRPSRFVRSEGQNPNQIPIWAKAARPLRALA
jgi:hypothetical protein